MIDKDFIKQVLELRGFSYKVSPESFNRVASMLYGMTLQDSQNLLFRFNEFTRGLNVYYNYEPDEIIEDINKAMEIANRSLKLEPEVERMHSIDFYTGVDDNYDKIMCYFVKRGDTVTRHELDLSLPVSYRIISNLMDEPDARILCAVECVDVLAVENRSYVDENGCDSKKSLKVYDGDIFVTYNKSKDSIWNREHDNGVYVAIDGCYRRLLYTEGRGYISKDMDPNIIDPNESRRNDDIVEFSEGKFTSYMMHLDHKWTRIGNIHVDVSCLMEKNLKEN